MFTRARAGKSTTGKKKDTDILVIWNSIKSCGTIFFIREKTCARSRSHIEALGSNTRDIGVLFLTRCTFLPALTLCPHTPTKEQARLRPPPLCGHMHTKVPGYQSTEHTGAYSKLKICLSTSDNALSVVFFLHYRSTARLRICGEDCVLLQIDLTAGLLICSSNDSVNNKKLCLMPFDYMPGGHK